MPSYGTIPPPAPSAPAAQHGTVDITVSHAGARPASSEQTPLLSVPGHSFFPGSGGVYISTSPRRDSDSTVGSDSEPLLAQVASGLTLGIEAEAVPATAGRPDAHGDFRLPRDADLRCRGDGDGAGFRGGITRRQFWLIFAGILAANFIAAFDSTIMASTHTSITSEFHASELASWLSTSFLLTSTSFQPLYGRVSDVVGRKGPFLFSCTVFTGATLWCALAKTFVSFVAARAVCGIGAGGGWPCPGCAGGADGGRNAHDGRDRAQRHSAH